MVRCNDPVRSGSSLLYGIHPVNRHQLYPCSSSFQATKAQNMKKYYYSSMKLTRRELLKSSLALPVLLSVPGISLKPTPAIADDDEITPSMTAGPFYKPSSPLRSSLLEPGVSGTRIVLSGLVLNTSANAIENTMLDFWQTDPMGNYDTAGYKFRGHQFTNEEGQYFLETMIPRGYSGRTKHIHVKLQTPNNEILITQLFFPGETRNESDFLFRPELLMLVQNSKASFDFVLKA